MEERRVGNECRARRERHALKNKDDSRIRGDAKVEARLSADRLVRSREALVDRDRYARDPGILGGYTGARTRGRAASSPGHARDDDVDPVALEIGGQIADDLGLARSVNVAESLVRHELRRGDALQDRLLDRFEHELAVELVVGQLAYGYPVQRARACRTPLRPPRAPAQWKDHLVLGHSSLLHAKDVSGQPSGAGRIL